MQNNASEEFHRLMTDCLGRMSFKGRKALLQGLEEFAFLRESEG